MIIKFRDNTQTTIEKKRGEKLIELLMSGDCPEYLKINEIVARKDYIVKVEPGGYTEADRITDDMRILDRPDHRGEPSPSKEALRKKFNL